MLERFLDMAVRSLRIATALPKSILAKLVALQFFRAATSGGANYCEACGAESAQDFAHKLQVVIKALRETDFRVKLIARSGMIGEARLKDFQQEVNELTALCVSTVETVKSNRGARRDR